MNIHCMFLIVPLPSARLISKENTECTAGICTAEKKSGEQNI